MVSGLNDDVRSKYSRSYDSVRSMSSAAHVSHQPTQITQARALARHYEQLRPFGASFRSRGASSRRHRRPLDLWSGARHKEEELRERVAVGAQSRLTAAICMTRTKVASDGFVVRDRTNVGVAEHVGNASHGEERTTRQPGTTRAADVK